MSEQSEFFPEGSRFAGYFTEKNQTERTKKALHTARSELSPQARERIAARILFSLDSTGAEKPKVLGKNLANIIRDRISEVDSSTREITQTREQKERPEESQYHFGMVGMVELDRINSENGHAGGNQAMNQTVTIIESSIRDSVQQVLQIDDIPPDFYHIYHLNGGEFAYTIDMQAAGVSHTQRAEVLNAIREHITQPSAEDQNNLLLSHANMPIEEAVTLFNDLQKRLISSGRDPIQQEQILRQLMSIMNKGVKFQNEINLLIAKTYKYIDMYHNADAASDVRVVYDYYEKYLKGRLTGIPDAENPDAPLSFRNSLIVRSSVRDQAKRDAGLRISRKVLGDFQHTAATDTFEDQVAFVAFTNEDLPTPQLPREDEGRYLDALPTEDRDVLESHEAQTKGGKTMREFKKMLDEVTAGTDGYYEGSELHIPGTVEEFNQLNDDERARFVRLVEFSSFLPQLSDSIQEISEGDRALIERIRERRVSMEGTTNDLELLKDIYEVAGFEYDLSTERVDELTGLADRREYQMTLQERLKYSSVQTVKVVFIDLGYLKYFNLGGRETGNYAIQRTAEIIEQALELCGAENAQAFRYAGDEFTVIYDDSSISSQQNEMQQRIIGTLDELVKSNDGLIPRTASSHRLYVPQHLTINYGFADGMEANILYDRLAEEDTSSLDPTLDPDHRYEVLAGLQTRIADLSVEYQKAESRFIQIFDILSDFEEIEEPSVLEIEQFKTFIDFSKKALFGLSYEQLAEMASDIDIGTIEGIAKLRDFIRLKINSTISEQARITHNENDLVTAHVFVKINEEQIYSYDVQKRSLTEQLNSEQDEERRRIIEDEIRQITEEQDKLRLL